MIDQRFSKTEFERRGLDTPAAKELADALATAVLEELRSDLRQSMERIVRELNAGGHNLRLYADAAPGELEFRDDQDSGPAYRCALRLALDSIASTGYAHLAKVEETAPV